MILLQVFINTIIVSHNVISVKMGGLNEFKNARNVKEVKT